MASSLATLACGVTAQAGTLLGMNHIGLASEYQGYLGGCTGASTDCLQVPQTMAIKAIEDAGDMGVGFMRVAITGYGPQNDAANRNQLTWELSPWLNDPNNSNSAYWTRMEQMFQMLDHRSIRLVPSFIFNPFAFPYYVREARSLVSQLKCSTSSTLDSETLATMVKVPTSCSRMMLKRYITDFIAHYQRHVHRFNRNTILFYELGNETNLLTDIDIVGGCVQSSGASNCTGYGNFTTLDLNKFAADIIQTIKTADTGAVVESGYAFPRDKAWGLVAQPAVAPLYRWPAADSEMQTETMMRVLHGTQTDPSYRVAWPQVSPGFTGGCPRPTANAKQCMFDVASAHIYPPQPGDQYWFMGGTHACAQGAGGGTCNPMDAMIHSLTQVGIPAFAGEFGDEDSAATDGAGNPSAAMQTLVANMQAFSTQVPYAAAWAWEFYGYAPAVKTATDRSFRAQNLVHGALAFSRAWDPVQPVPGNLEPGFTDGFNLWLRHSFGLLRSSFVDNGSPRLVLTSVCSARPNDVTIYAATSARAGIRDIAFSIGDLPAGVTVVQSGQTTPQNSNSQMSIGYSSTFTFPQGQPGPVTATINVTATGNTGRVTTASKTVTILPNGQTPGSLFCSYPN